MDKLKMAHDWYLKQLEVHENASVHGAWQYADAMQAEADKRVNKERPDVLLTKDKDGNCLHFHHEFGHKKCMDCGASLEEWQPDWSKAPETAIAWKMQSKSNAVWIHNKSLSAFEYNIAPSFNYQGNWQNSLRKRPQ